MKWLSNGVVMLSVLTSSQGQAVTCPLLIKKIYNAAARVLTTMAHPIRPLERAFFYRGLASPPLKFSAQHSELLFNKPVKHSYKHFVIDSEGNTQSEYLVQRWEAPPELIENLKKISVEANLSKLEDGRGEFIATLEFLKNTLDASLNMQHSAPSVAGAEAWAHASFSTKLRRSRERSAPRGLAALLGDVIFILKIAKSDLSHRYTKPNIVPPYENLYEGLFDAKWLQDQPVEKMIEYVVINNKKYHPDDPRVRTLWESRVELQRKAMELYIDAGLEGWPANRLKSKLEELVNSQDWGSHPLDGVR